MSQRRPCIRSINKDTVRFAQVAACNIIRKIRRVSPKGFEPPTPGLKVRCSSQTELRAHKYMCCCTESFILLLIVLNAFRSGILLCYQKKKKTCYILLFLYILLKNRNFIISIDIIYNLVIHQTFF